MPKKRTIKFIATAVRWFDKCNGNTYHSVRISKVSNGKLIVCPFTYGYGEQYRDTALRAMELAKWIPPKYRGQESNGSHRVWGYERNNNYPIIWHVSDGLKRDCIANGKD